MDDSVIILVVKRGVQATCVPRTEQAIRSNQEDKKCVEWRQRSWMDSTPPCPFASMQRAGKFGVLANFSKNLDRFYIRRDEKKSCAWRCVPRVGDLVRNCWSSLVGQSVNRLTLKFYFSLNIYWVIFFQVLHDTDILFQWTLDHAREFEVSRRENRKAALRYKLSGEVQGVSS